MASTIDNDRKKLWELMDLQLSLNNTVFLLKQNPTAENIKTIRQIEKVLKKYIDNDVIVYSKLINTKPRKRSRAIYYGFKKQYKSRKSRKSRKCRKSRKSKKNCSIPELKK